MNWDAESCISSRVRRSFLEEFRRLCLLSPEWPHENYGRIELGQGATSTLLSAGDLIGDEWIAGALGLRMATATPFTTCTTLKIGRDEMIRVLHEEHAFSDLFLKFLLVRNIRTQADLVGFWVLRACRTQPSLVIGTWTPADCSWLRT